MGSKLSVSTTVEQLEVSYGVAVRSPSGNRPGPLACPSLCAVKKACDGRVRRTEMEHRAEGHSQPEVRRILLTREEMINELNGKLNGPIYPKCRIT